MLTIITGHYGSGKTTLSLNLAVNSAKSGKKTAIADLDIVNPFFRTADSLPLLEELGIEAIIPYGANSNLESVYLPPEVEKLFRYDGNAYLDIGGDDDGAIVLGRYAEKIAAAGYEMICVISRYRPFTKDPKDAAEMIASIEATSRLKVTGLVNTSSLGDDTDGETVLASACYAKEVSRLSGKPLLYTAVKKDVLATLSDGEKETLGDILPIEIYTKRLF
ncbi:MAG: ParA family protein [Clostridia bacterium]|nr:ParA family protein [Clostridia bacterium]